MGLRPGQHIALRVLVSWFLALLLVACASTGAETGQAANRATAAASAIPVSLPASGASSANSPASQPDLRVAIADAADKVRPAVVQITTEVLERQGLFQVVAIETGVGSGIIYDREGYILTNHHVIAGADRLTVTLTDGRTFPGTLVGTDPRSDVAVVRIAGGDLPVAALGDSTQLRVGEWVVAIGDALGLPGGPSVTLGIVSATGRIIHEPSVAGGPDNYLYDLIQTDAPINPGNSGGALVNLSGQVIGINTLTTVENSKGVPVQGISYAIGMASAKPVADEIVQSGHALSRFLGIAYVPLTPLIDPTTTGKPQGSGLVVRSILPQSPAAKAGVRAGDTITAINGAPMYGESTVRAVLTGRAQGEKLLLTVQRGGEKIRLYIEMPVTR